MKSLGCPQQVELKQFVVGRVDDSVADRIESHIKVCLACAAALDALDAEAYPQAASALELDETDEESTRLTAFLSRLRHLSHRDSSSNNAQGPRRPTLVDSLGHLSRYKIRECLRVSRMSEVYRAYDSALDREVALKVLPSHHRDDTESSLRFVREMKNAAGLRHANIVPVLDAGEVDGVCYYTMEFIQGANFAQVLRGHSQEQHSELTSTDCGGIKEETANAAAFAKQIFDRLYDGRLDTDAKRRREYHQAIVRIVWMVADALS
jgi:hypothetical protein